MTIRRFQELVIAACIGAVVGSFIGGFASYVVDKARYDAAMARDMQAIRSYAVKSAKGECQGLAPCTSPRPKPRPEATDG